MIPRWPFVGRSSDLERIVALLTLPRPRAVVLAGPAGVGKTRLAVECLTKAEHAGHATARATASRSAAEIPLGAIAPLLPVGSESQTGSVDHLMDLLRRSADALVDGAGGRRLVLLVDDAHLLDHVSATLVHQLAAHQAASVLVTLRTGEPAPDPIVGMWKDDLAERFDVEGLGISEIERLLSSVLGGPVDQAAIADLTRMCDGNALFLRELVSGAIRDGSLRDDGGIWRFVLTSAPSERLVELVETRLAGLSVDERALLELVAFAEVVGAPELETLGPDVWDIADRLERKALLAGQSDAGRLEVRLAHPLYGEVLRDRLPSVRRTLLARTLADAVEAAGRSRNDDLLRVATWRLRGGGGSPKMMMEAATIARWRYDFPLAERLAAAAVERGAGFDAELMLAQLAGLQGRGEDCDAKLIALAENAHDDAQRGQAAIARLDNVAFHLGHPKDAVKVAEQAESAITDPLWRDDLASRRVALVGMIDGPRSAVAVADPLLQRATDRALVWAALPAALELGRLGDVDRSLELSSRAHAEHLTLRHPLDWYPWTHLFVRCQALSRAGRLAEAQMLATEQYHQALRERSPEAQAWFAWHLASVVEVQGHVSYSIAKGREAVALFRQLGRPQFTYLSGTSLTLALALGGRADDAAASLRALDELGLPTTRLLGIDPLLARAWTTVSTGDLAAARDLFHAAAEVGEDIGDLTGTAGALHAVARLGRPQEAAPRLADLGNAVQGPLGVTRFAHADALVRHDPEALTLVADAFENMGADLLAAESAADAAVAWQRFGETRRATAAQLRAQRLTGHCEGAVTPALQVTGARERLTPAEYEAVMLAAAGRSNKEIAAQLFLSVRSVEGRLLRAFPKLGVGSRAELPMALESLAMGTNADHKADECSTRKIE